MKKYNSNQPGLRHAVSEFDNKKNVPVMSKGPSKPYPSKASIQAAGHEMKASPPRILAHTKRKFGKTAAKKQKIAIMLDKARRGR